MRYDGCELGGVVAISDQKVSWLLMSAGWWSGRICSRICLITGKDIELALGLNIGKLRCGIELKNWAGS